MSLIEREEDFVSSWWRSFYALQEQNLQITSSYVEEIQKYLPFSPTLIGDLFIKAGHALLKNPSHLLEAQTELLSETTALWQKIIFPQNEAIDQPLIDKRFHHDAWQTVPYFLFVKEYYLMTARWLNNIVSHIEGLDELTSEKLKFYTNQLVEAVSPTNFPFTNPEVLEELVKTDGDSLRKGFQALLDDMETGRWMKMTDSSAFKLGETIASTKGEVVFRNDLFELIHYSPLTEKQYAVPLLIIPPWINKYYIFDLSPHNSFVKWMLEQGHNVFIISWINPGSEIGSKTFEDYL